MSCMSASPRSQSTLLEGYHCPISLPFALQQHKPSRTHSAFKCCIKPFQASQLSFSRNRSLAGECIWALALDAYWTISCSCHCTCTIHLSVHWKHHYSFKKRELKQRNIISPPSEWVTLIYCFLLHFQSYDFKNNSFVYYLLQRTWLYT